MKWTAAELSQLAHEIVPEVEELRARTFKHAVPFETLSEVQYRSLYRADVTRELQPGGDLEWYLIASQRAGLRQPDSPRPDEESQAPTLTALYHPRTKVCHFIDEQAARSGPFLTRASVAHELTHALDDQYVYLLRYRASRDATSDFYSIVQGIQEGSATVLEFQYIAGHVRQDVQTLQQAGSWEVIGPALARVLDNIIARSAVNKKKEYVIGANFLLRGDWTKLADPEARASLRENVDQAFEHPPRSEEQVLYPEKYWDPARRDEPSVIDDDAVERLLAEEGWRVVYKNTWGEMNCALLATEGQGSVRLSWTQSITGGMTLDCRTAAAGWGGDRFYLIVPDQDREHAERPRDAAQAVWFTVWDSSDARDGFVRDYDRFRILQRPSLKCETRAAVFFYRIPTDRQIRLEQRIAAMPPPVSQAGRRAPFGAAPQPPP